MATPSPFIPMRWMPHTRESYSINADHPYTGIHVQGAGMEWFVLKKLPDGEYERSGPFNSAANAKIWARIKFRKRADPASLHEAFNV